MAGASAGATRRTIDGSTLSPADLQAAPKTIVGTSGRVYRPTDFVNVWTTRQQNAARDTIAPLSGLIAVALLELQGMATAVGDGGRRESSEREQRAE